jgi:hypothetical protein
VPVASVVADRLLAVLKPEDREKNRSDPLIAIPIATHELLSL